jgi:hypothetical protein
VTPVNDEDESGMFPAPSSNRSDQRHFISDVFLRMAGTQFARGGRSGSIQGSIFQILFLGFIFAVYFLSPREQQANLSMRDGNAEPFLINAANGSSTAGKQRRISYVRRDRGSNIDANFANLNLGNDDGRGSASALNTLRRRYQRRGTSNLEPDVEDGKQNESHSPRDEAAVPESNENALEAKGEGPENAKEPRFARPSRHSALTTQPAVDDATSKTVEERKTQHDIQLPIIHHSSYIRKPDEKLREKFKDLIRSPADGIPEVHIMGELSEGVGFRDTFVSCKW